MRTVTAYYLYFMTSRDHVARRIDLDCRDDEHAIQVVSEHVHHQAMELWQAERLVRRFEPGPSN